MLEPSRTALVCMPWLLVDSPSIQLGMLQAVLAQANLAATAHSFHLAWLEFATRQAGAHEALTVAEYEAISTRWSNCGVPEWLFAVPPWLPEPKVGERPFLDLLRRAGMPPALLEKVQRLRRQLPAFIEACAAEVLATAPALVGFTLVYSQTVPSVALARAIKRRAPAVQIVFGGALCEGPSGPAMLRAYEEVDYVVRGEGEAVLGRLVRHLGDADLEAVRALPGLCWRRDGVVFERPTDAAQRVPMDELPLPEYGEYFARLARGPLHGVITPRLPYQSARGCWWGMKSHCKFCGINGTDLAFRSRSPARVHEDLVELSRQYGVLDFTIVDNIMDMRYLTTVIPALAKGPHDLALFCETKSNLSHAQVRLLGAAGVRTIQPGIESLSTSILQQMGKGVTGLQNIRLLKWCAEAGLHVIWNLLYGFPREDPAEYARMAGLVKSLVHLTPPNLGPLMLVRFSPYHEAPARYGLRLGPPLPFYAQMYGAPADTLHDLAAVFEHSHDDGRDVETYVTPLREQVAQWQADAQRNRGALTWRRGPGFLVVTDTRTTMPAPARYHLDAVEAAVHLACDAGAAVGAIVEAVQRETGCAIDEARVVDVLQGFLAAHIACEEDGKYLTLAIPAVTAWGRAAAMAPAVSAATARHEAVGQ